MALKSHPTNHRPTITSFSHSASQPVSQHSPPCRPALCRVMLGAGETQGTVLAKAQSHKRPDLETGAGPLGFTCWLLPVPPPGPSTGYQVRRQGPEKPAVVCSTLFSVNMSQILHGTYYTETSVAIYLKLKFKCMSCIFICYIWHPYPQATPIPNPWPLGSHQLAFSTSYRRVCTCTELGAVQRG